MCKLANSLTGASGIQQFSNGGRWILRAQFGYAALLGGASFTDLWPPMRALLLFAAVLLPLSFAVFSWALRRTKITGTLTHF